ncbi:MAG: pentapeptide repeat-containing protein [Acidobacteriota bacterium]|nr:pentapeptide repeat-containing protein [Acidobacteriota bacterium]
MTIAVLVLTFTATDRVLFTNSDLVAPLINVALPTSIFFVAAPIALLLLHLNLLLQGTFLAQRVIDCRAALASTPELGDERLGTLPSAPLAQLATERSSGVPRSFLTLWAFVTVALLPLVTLGVLQAQFLDFQSPRITGFHSVLLVTDSALLLAFWRKLRRVSPARCRTKPVYVWGTTVTMAAFLLLAHAGRYPMPNPLPAFTLTQDLTDRLSSLYQLTVRDRRLHLSPSLPAAPTPCEESTVGLDLTSRSFRHAKLTGSVLCHATLVRADLSRADLRGVDLRDADLRKAHLQLADLSHAKLQDADLYEARLHGAALNDAKLHRANLTFARLYGAYLARAEFLNADLFEANLSWSKGDEATFRGADMRRAVLVGTRLSFADLSGAHLGGAWIVGASMFETLLHGTSLSGTQVIGTELTSAEPLGVDLTFARLSGSNLRFSELYGAEINEDTRLSGVVIKPSFRPFRSMGSLRELVGTRTQLNAANVVGLVPREVISGVARIDGANEDVKTAVLASLERMRKFPDEDDLNQWRLSSLVKPYSEVEATMWLDLFSMDYCRFRTSPYSRFMDSPSTYGVTEESTRQSDQGSCPDALVAIPLWAPFPQSAF